ncbi:predicted protein [Plenodomus lingam JN3]|uniref:Predicted protein n=1 Tax=Leptosphaeria maculans (strain JN3 / isolate v23.1.3 / race Av1-4-5-6-7-8) TaxID=985895 RepID=E5ABG8_LEPMJ|nr:predicted protein [Plenodomus lingam JN3]CBY01009.1 predicted protein [Plenodomus lingam JN3]
MPANHAAHRVVLGLVPAAGFAVIATRANLAAPLFYQARCLSLSPPDVIPITKRRTSAFAKQVLPQRSPQSATMSMNENVGQLLDVICYQLDKEEATKLLAISGKNLQAAVQKFYDTDIESLRSLLRDSPATWDESAFGAGRYGDNDATLPTFIAAFNIDYAPGFENYPHSTGHSRAPTRPPSRTSQHSALSTHAGDAPMQSIEGPQESGVVGNANTVFGPATQSHYEASQWAIVPTATEVIADPTPSQRQREEGQPAILKPSPNFNHLQCLIPILHSIPQFRNALLSPGVVATDYWVGEDWWRGVASPSARIIDGSKGLAEMHGLDILYEAQRLMAFLDNTDRIYGSVDALLSMDAWKESRPAGLEDEDDDLLKFLLLWGFAFQTQVPDAELNGSLRSVVNVAGQHVENFVLDGAVTRHSSRPDVSVYDVLDDTLFSGNNGSAHLVEPSNVLILRLTSSTTNASDIGCRVPATVYIDRYLEKNKHIIESMYSDMQQHEEQLGHINNQVERLKYHTPARPGARRVESLKLLETSIKAYQPRTNGSDSESRDAEVLAQLQHLYQSIESKLAILEEQAQQIQKTRDSICARFKPIIDDGADIVMDATATDFPEGQSPQDAMHRPYKLWGVATRRDVVYLLHPDITSDVPDAQQWWRMQYDTESVSPVIMRDRLSLQDVLERATTESATVLLVYANEAATTSEPAPLSKPLLEFVKKDNLNFLEELQKTSKGWETYGEDYSATAGDWDKDALPPDYGSQEYKDDDWNNMSAREFHSHGHGHGVGVGVDDNMSSATLTPNTEVEEADGKPEMDTGVVMREMVEVGAEGDREFKRRRESSETIGEERGERARETRGDVEMRDGEVEQRKGG